MQEFSTVHERSRLSRFETRPEPHTGGHLRGLVMWNIVLRRYQCTTVPNLQHFRPRSVRPRAVAQVRCSKAEQLLGSEWQK